MMRQTNQRPPNHPGRFAYEGLERVLHERARLGVVTSLAMHPEGLLFNDLKELCALTDGNLSRHLQVLEEEGIVEIWKGSAKRRTQTLCRLSETGRKRFLDYISVLESVVADAAAVSKTTAAVQGKPRQAWSPT